MTRFASPSSSPTHGGARRSGDEKLRPTERLHSSHEYRTIFRSGRRFRTRQIRIHYLKTARELSRLGLVVSRHRGKAHDRNRIKRWLREVFRRAKHGIPGTFDVVLIPETSTAGYEDYQSAFEEFVRYLVTRSARTREPPGRRGPTVEDQPVAKDPS